MSGFWTRASPLGLGEIFPTTTSVRVACSVHCATEKTCENVTVAMWKESFKAQSHNAAYWRQLQHLCLMQGAGWASVHGKYEVVEKEHTCSLHEAQMAVTLSLIISDIQYHVPGMGAEAQVRRRNTSSFVLPQLDQFMFCVTTAHRLHDPSRWLGGGIETSPKTGLAPRGRRYSQRRNDITGPLALLHTEGRLPAWLPMMAQLPGNSTAAVLCLSMPPSDFRQCPLGEVHTRRVRLSPRSSDSRASTAVARPNFNRATGVIFHEADQLGILKRPSRP